MGDFGDVGVDNGPAGGLGVDGGEVGFGEHVADDAAGSTCVHQVVDDHPAFAVAFDTFEDIGIALVLVIVGRDANGVDETDVEFAGDDMGRHEAAAGDGDDALPGGFFGESPGEGAGVAVQLVPAYGIVFDPFLAQGAGLA